LCVRTLRDKTNDRAALVEFVCIVSEVAPHRIDLPSRCTGEHGRHLVLELVEAPLARLWRLVRRALHQPEDVTYHLGARRRRREPIAGGHGHHAGGVPRRRLVRRSIRQVADEFGCELDVPAGVHGDVDFPVGTELHSRHDVVGAGQEVPAGVAQQAAVVVDGHVQDAAVVVEGDGWDGIEAGPAVGVAAAAEREDPYLVGCAGADRAAPEADGGAGRVG
jgi:hypothetical protein